ncbi:membrane protein insertase YidC [Clostridium paraputrificum]|uniref:membrane protein insertase YidC n=1 Tax=Clostridium TaxID=1485 RepID=UPI003D3450D2
MENLINFIYLLTGDLGLTIIVLTLGVKILMLPLSIKSKKTSLEQIEVNNQIDEIKKKYKKNKRKLEEEVKKLQSESVKSIGGCFTQFLQIPVVSLLYITINSISVEAATLLVPWVESIKLSDPFFIIPIIYVMVSLLPTIVNLFKKENKEPMTVMNFLPAIFSFLITIKAPIALGLYFITSGFFTFLEGEGFKLYSRKIGIN